MSDSELLAELGALARECGRDDLAERLAGRELKPITQADLNTEYALTYRLARLAGFTSTDAARVLMAHHRIGETLALHIRRGGDKAATKAAAERLNAFSDKEKLERIAFLRKFRKLSGNSGSFPEYIGADRA